ncbi:hypothetical protein J1605_019615 [Eschrichtius robustus]|uniref:Nuclear/hormone receptor activator site AF-1 domain-containing protein n=1 Tax=Eschrichtius robustus TaxID=9764 RepID=A0AB34HN23_ESCRO|nr:hypothetical protein J1605_019615 [Eschrichtius robustus]
MVIVMMMVTVTMVVEPLSPGPAAPSHSGLPSSLEVWATLGCGVELGPEFCSLQADGLLGLGPFWPVGGLSVGAPEAACPENSPRGVPHPVLSSNSEPPSPPKISGQQVERASKGGGAQQAGGYRMEMGKCSQRRGSPGLAEPPMFLREPPHPTGWPPPSTSMDKFTRPWRKLGSGRSRVYPALTVGSGVLQPVPETQFAPVTKVDFSTQVNSSSLNSPTGRGSMAAPSLHPSLGPGIGSSLSSPGQLHSPISTLSSPINGMGPPFSVISSPMGPHSMSVPTTPTLGFGTGSPQARTLPHTGCLSAPCPDPQARTDAASSGVPGLSPTVASAHLPGLVVSVVVSAQLLL